MTVSSAKPFSASDPILSLDVGDVHLWFCHSQEILGDADSDTFKRNVLSRYAAIAPGEWRFARGPHGKPRLQEAPVALDFNLSHSGDWLCCAVTGGMPVGIDIEFCNPQRDLAVVARRFFQAGEVLDLDSGPPAGTVERFYEYWTLKEADIKSRGEALGPQLEQVGFTLTGQEVSALSPLRITRLSSPPAGPDAFYLLLEPAPDYRVAACLLTDKGLVPRLGTFELCEDGSAGTLPARLLGASGDIAWRAPAREK